MSVAAANRHYRDRERKRSRGPAIARIVHAADFVTGGPGAFARAADRRGVTLFRPSGPAGRSSTSCC